MNLLLFMILSAGVFDNDVDEDGDQFVATIIESTQNGALSFNATTGAFMYTPNAGFTGEDKFVYKLTDSTGLVSNPTTVTINVNNKPVAVADNYRIKKNQKLLAGNQVTLTVVDPNAEGAETTHTIGYTGVLANDTDADRQSLRARVVSPPPVGNLQFEADGQFEYVPPSNFIGRVTWTYVCDDGIEDSDPAVVTIDVSNAPKASMDAYTTPQDAELIVN